ncbi:hypothetical protein SPAN111604_09455 [Sphingomonas antarctica]
MLLADYSPRLALYNVAAFRTSRYYELVHDTHEQRIEHSLAGARLSYCNEQHVKSLLNLAQSRSMERRFASLMSDAIRSEKLNNCLSWTATEHPSIEV